MVFPVVMYGCESWTIKRAERWRTDAFELWCWRRLLRVPWTARKSNQSILKETSPEISLEAMMLKLKLQYFGHLMRRVDSLEKTLMLGGIGGRRRRGRQRMRWLWWHPWLDGREFVWTLGDGDGQAGLVCCDSWGRKESDMTERLNWIEWLTLIYTYSAYKLSKQSDHIQPRNTPFPIWSRLFFHVQFSMLLLELHTDFSGGMSGGLVFPSLSELSTVYCDPHSQRLWYS